MQQPPPPEAIFALAQRLARIGACDPLGGPIAPLGLIAPAGQIAPVEWRPTPTGTLVGRVGDGQPLLRTDLAAAMSTPKRLLRGLAALGLLRRARRLVLAIRDDYWELLGPLRRATEGSAVELRGFAPRYPLAPDDLLCDLWSGQQDDRDPPARIPLEGTSVYDATTLCDVGAALDGAALPRRLVTVAGAVAQPAVLEVPLGTPLIDLVRACGCEAFGWQVLHNAVLPVDAEAPVELDTRGLLVIPVRHGMAVANTTPAADLARRCASACVNCRICTDVCPVFLDGGHLEPHRTVHLASRDWLADPPADQPAALSALECRACRVCDLACPASLEPGRLIAAVGQRLRERGVDLAGGPDLPARGYPLSPREARDGRRMSISRATDQLGLGTFATPATPARTCVPDRLIFPLVPRCGPRRHPMVAQGDAVRRGDTIAGSDDGHCLAAPIDGQVARVDPEAGIVLDVA